MIRGLLVCAALAASVLAIHPAMALETGIPGPAGALPWWAWPMILLVITFALGVVAVLGGVGGGVLFVPIIGSFFPFHLDFVRGGGLLIALAGSLAATVMTLAVSAQAADMNQKMEKCYGVAMKGHNDCKAAYPGATCAGSQKVDYDGQSFKEVPAGTCATMQTPFGPGSLTPIKRPA